MGQEARQRGGLYRSWSAEAGAGTSESRNLEGVKKTMNNKQTGNKMQKLSWSITLTHGRSGPSVFCRVLKYSAAGGGNRADALQVRAGGVRNPAQLQADR
ncbi:hypothetical protein NQD34_008272 [Periophthalmus magnuspinnatus]|nr:hypothetical protein NQD34_008272 [Periophthalmus magnuspinnatus]